jgi:hypothetical protein
MSLDYITMSRLEAVAEEFERLFDSTELDDEYMEYIMENCHGERIIGNGDMLIKAMEEGFLYQDFREYWIEKNC